MTGVKMFCQVCNLTLNSYDQFEVHKAGKAHKRKEKGTGTSAGSVLPQSAPVAKIVRPNSFIRFVTSQGGNSSTQSQDTTLVLNAEDNAAGNSTQNEPRPARNEAFCTICVVKLTSQALADMHYAGAKHKRAVALTVKVKSEEDSGVGVKRKSEDICEICNVPIKTKAVADAHYAGAKHGKKLKLSHDINTTKTFSGNTTQPTYPGVSFPPQKNPNGPVGQKLLQPGSMFFCSFCKVSVNSQGQMDAHRQGTKHKNAVNGIVQQRQKVFTPRQPQQDNNNRFVSPRQPQQDHSRFVSTRQPQQDHSRFVSPSHHFHFGNPNGPMQFRPGPSMAYQAPQY